MSIQGDMPRDDFWMPPEPAEPEGGRAESRVELRYEDIAQDGRLILLAMPHTIGQVVWRHMIEKHEGARAAMRAGMLPVLTRLVLEGTDTTISVRKPAHFSGCFQLAHTVDAAGEVNRLVLNIWTRGDGIIGRTHGPQPEDAGTTAPVGRVFAEHTFTRLFAPPDQRKVLRLDVPGISEPVPSDRYDWHPPEDLLVLPAGATPLDDALAPDDVAMAFGLTHTDSNQHVNSLVYPSLFEEAALRRFGARGRRTDVLARTLECAYRKPMFAGQRARIVLRAYEHAGRLGAVGVFVPDPADLSQLGRAHAFLRMTFS